MALEQKQREPAPKGAKTRGEERAEADVPVVRARARFVRSSARKVRVVADQVRGQPVVKARSLLEFSPRRAAEPIRKLLDSASANAENNYDLDSDEMRIAELAIDEGPTMRRYRPRARGRATKIEKRTSHLRIALVPLTEDEITELGV